MIPLWIDRIYRLTFMNYKIKNMIIYSNGKNVIGTLRGDNEYAMRVSGYKKYTVQEYINKLRYE